MAEEKKETWLNYVAISSIVFAVCATLSTFKGGQYSTRTVLGQSKAANLWAYYQAKDLKSYLHELQIDVLNLDIARTKDERPELVDEYRKRIASYEDKLKKYDAQKKDIETQAREQESAIATTQAHSQAFGLAVIFLQIAILLSSISALMKRIHIWYASLAIGTVGIVYFFDGLLLFF